MRTDRFPEDPGPADDPLVSSPEGQGMRPAGPTHGQLSADVGGDARPASDQPAVPGHDSATQIVPARSVTRTRTGGIWIGVIVAALVFIVLLIFIVQNTASVTIHFFGFAGALPIAVALLLAAVCGVLLVAIPGTVRILQLRKAVRKPTPR